MKHWQSQWHTTHQTNIDRALGSLSNDIGMFRSTIAKQICHTRTLLRLPQVDIESLLNAER